MEMNTQNTQNWLNNQFIWTSYTQTYITIAIPPEDCLWYRVLHEHCAFKSKVYVYTDEQNEATFVYNQQIWWRCQWSQGISGDQQTKFFSCSIYEQTEVITSGVLFLSSIREGTEGNHGFSV
jgi:hypothetical protein